MSFWGQRNSWCHNSSRVVLENVNAPCLFSMEFCKAVWDSLGVANEQQTQSQFKWVWNYIAWTTVYFQREISFKDYILLKNYSPFAQRNTCEVPRTKSRYFREGVDLFVSALSRFLFQGLNYPSCHRYFD